MTSIDHKRRDLQVLPSKLLSPLITAMVYRNNDRMAKRQLLLQYSLNLSIILRQSFEVKRILWLITKKLMQCGCRCIICKYKQLESFSFVAPDGFDEIHHTCLSCGIHFNHLDGSTYPTCQKCNYMLKQKNQE